MSFAHKQQLLIFSFPFSLFSHGLVTNDNKVIQKRPRHVNGGVSHGDMLFYSCFFHINARLKSLTSKSLKSLYLCCSNNSQALKSVLYKRMVFHWTTIMLAKTIGIRCHQSDAVLRLRNSNLNLYPIRLWAMILKFNRPSKEDPKITRLFQEDYPVDRIAEKQSVGSVYF